MREEKEIGGGRRWRSRRYMKNEYIEVRREEEGENERGRNG